MKRVAALALLVLCSTLAQAEVTIQHEVSNYLRIGGGFWQGTQASGSEPQYQVDYAGSLARVAGSGHYGSMSGEGRLVVNASEPQYRATGVAFVNNRWDDTITLHSSSLAAGTPVSLEVTLFLRSNQSAGGADQRVSAQVVCGIWANFLNVQSDGLVAQSQTSACNGTVGGTLNFDGELYGRSGAEAMNGNVIYSSFEGQAWYSVRALTPGVSISSASGALYLQPVPEPGTYALMLGGLALLGLRQRQRR